MNKRTAIVLFCIFALLFLSITKTISLYSAHVSRNETAELRKSPSKNLIQNPLVESSVYKDWNLYKSRFLSYSFSVPKDWVIKECQENEDCEYHSATRINKINDQDNFLQISVFSEGKSQCIFGLYSKNNQIDNNLLNKLKYGFTNYKIQIPIQHDDWCFEILGNYTNNSEGEILLKILESFRFKD